ncbi:hypothetical protein K437DRAFT_259318 [Tilletiaria anomala UBC 951]|uniref:Haem-binding uptake Tiki superfamily ChaN domain-containing protein n=1 Tax=Tilletiaria anomala (strain ATCC 24038 / CBS 436.72 / UBC 951) TaxID=1037660 RepID=A0A066VAD7_TILAU|nr:uncharacterized protein K437DRAFT_259318 [Tilletiaria anomala UBC 951]KDN38712.1 hypothetical protein K437DRAFT_259318 [Tilletiaria anomala UBC 951]
MTGESAEDESMISHLIHKLSPPRLLLSQLPTFRSCCVHESARNGVRMQQWNQMSNFEEKELHSFVEIYNRRARPPRLVFFGEQHHQPQVLHAQMQALHDLVRAFRALESPKSEPQARGPRISMVIEHFSLLDQALLDGFVAGDLQVAELAEMYGEESQEGFDMSHYIPLLVLAQELGVRVVGGFPPRQWAKLAFKDGLDAVKDAERTRMSYDTSNHAAPAFTRWDLVTNISLAHRSYIKSLMRPNQPVIFPALPPDVQEPQSEAKNYTARYPTELLCEPGPQSKGFETAQALKDAFFAHTITSQLINSASGCGDGIVFAICGLGHSEYGMGAVERTMELLRERYRPSDDTIEPFLIASKPDDGSFWTADVTDQVAEEDSQIAWAEDAWDRKLADAVVLYKWRDEGN